MRGRTRKLLFIVAALFVVFGALSLAAYRNAEADPVVRRLAVRMDPWPLASLPLRIALLSDVHMGSPTMDAERLERIVSQVNGLSPDLVLFAGDFVFGHDPAAGARFAAELSAPLSRLRPPLGVLAVLGNHDHWTAPEQIKSALSAAGVTVLQNETVRRGPIRIVGIDDAFSGRARVAEALASAGTEAGPRLILTHAPDVAKELPKNAGLILAGHTHCGQIVLPLIGAPVTRSPYSNLRKLYDPRYRCGVIRDAGRLVVVTAGLGSSGVPFRLGADPDLWLISIGR